MPPPPTPTHPANQAYFNTILNPSQIANAQSPSSASPFSANKAATSSSTTPTHASNTFKTPREKENERLMRSAQARNKTYRNEIDEGGRQGGGSARATIRGGGGAGRGRSPESFDARQKREWAAAVLANLEMVIWYAGVRNESLSQTRTYFQNIVLGLPEPSSTPIYPSRGLESASHMYTPTPTIMWREEWEVPEHQRVRDRDRDRDQSRDRGRDRGGGDGEDTVMGGTGSGSPARRDKGKGKKRVSSAGSGLD